MKPCQTSYFLFLLCCFLLLEKLLGKKKGKCGWDESVRGERSRREGHTATALTGKLAKREQNMPTKKGFQHIIGHSMVPLFCCMTVFTKTSKFLSSSLHKCISSLVKALKRSSKPFRPGKKVRISKLPHTLKINTHAGTCSAHTHTQTVSEPFGP